MDEKFKKSLEVAGELEKMDFENIGDFDYEHYYSHIEKIAQKNINFKNEEAENVIKNDATTFISEEYAGELEEKRNTVETFIRKYDPNNSDIVENVSEHGLDKIYAICNYLLNAYIQYVNEMEFKMEFSKHEIVFLNKLLTKEIEYNGDEVFNFVDFYEKFWAGAWDTYLEDKTLETYTFNISIKQILILHHLIKEHKVKGRTTDFTNFRNVLYKIAQTNKLFNAYNIVIERIKNDRELWGNAIDIKIKELNEERERANGTTDTE